MSPGTFNPRILSELPLSGRMQSDQLPTGQALYLLQGQYWVSLSGYIWVFLHLSFFLLLPEGTEGNCVGLF